jgi:hypothetical protein
MGDVTVTDRQLVGRDEELAAIVRLLDAPEELSRITVLSGAAGIGKTSLWLAGIDAAAAHGYRILSSRPSEAETGLSFAGLADLLGNAAGEVLPEPPPIQQRALEAALLLGESGLHADDRAVAAAFLGALRLLAAAEPLCLAVDDVQWLDAASLAALRYALARLDDERVAASAGARCPIGHPSARGGVAARAQKVPAVAGNRMASTKSLWSSRSAIQRPGRRVVRRC